MLESDGDKSEWALVIVCRTSGRLDVSERYLGQPLQLYAELSWCSYLYSDPRNFLSSIFIYFVINLSSAIFVKWFLLTQSRIKVLKYVLHSKLFGHTLIFSQCWYIFNVLIYWIAERWCASNTVNNLLLEAWGEMLQQGRKAGTELPIKRVKSTPES